MTHPHARSQFSVSRKGLLDRFALGAVAAGVRVADKFDVARAGCGERKQCPVGFDAAERRAALFALGAFLYQYGMRPAFEPLGQHDGRIGPGGGGDAGVPAVDEYVVVVAARVRGPHGAARALESEREVAAAPVERQRSPGALCGAAREADFGRVGGGEHRAAAAARSGPAGEEQQGENQFFHRFILFSARYVFPKRSRAVTSTRRVPAGSGAA